MPATTEKQLDYLTIGGQDILGLACRAMTGGHHRERNRKLDIQELQALFLCCQSHDLLLESLVLFLQRMKGLEHFYNCRKHEGEVGRETKWSWEDRGGGETTAVIGLDYSWNGGMQAYKVLVASLNGGVLTLYSRGPQPFLILQAPLEF